MPRATGIDAARQLIAQAVATGRVPCASVHVGSSSTTLWTDALGRLTPASDAPAANPDTWFDLASLTKPLATTTVMLDLLGRGAVTLEEPVGRAVAGWRGEERLSVTIADLLEHSSGLPARLVEAPPTTGAAFARAICAVPLEYPPRTRSVYSDLGFILLGLLASELDGHALDVQFARQLDKVVGRSPAARAIGFAVPADRRQHTAPTRPLSDDARGGDLLQAVVHDPYAAALGGVAGHSGLFGTAAAVAAIARVILKAARGEDVASGPFSVAMTRRAIRRSAVPGSSRALGWDCMLPTSSCGPAMSPEAFGHVGFTGTSLWIDPSRDRYYVLLTNRVCGSCTLDEMRELRRGFHDALATV